MRLAQPHADNRYTKPRDTWGTYAQGEQCNRTRFASPLNAETRNQRRSEGVNRTGQVEQGNGAELYFP